MTAATREDRATRLADRLSQFTGSISFFWHELHRKVFYSEGVQFLAEAGDAHWLIDAIASHYVSKSMRKAMERDERLQWLHLWFLEVTEHRGILQARADEGVPPFIEQEIRYTDFPLDRIQIWAGFNGCQWVLYLPSEH